MNFNYRKKPVVIQAWQLTHKNIRTHIHGFIERIVIEQTAEGELFAKINTLEGVMTASQGDWIIRGIHGELYPCKPDIFEQTYEAVGE